MKIERVVTNVLKQGTMSRAVSALLLTCGIACAAQGVAGAGPNGYSKVDPRIGTAHDGQTFPAVGVPFAMTSWTPETQATEAKCVAPYYDKDTRLTGFRGSHWLSGGCTQEYGSVTVMPTTGALKTSAAGRASRFEHGTETMGPAYYAVEESDYKTRVEMTGSARAGILRVTYPKSGEANLIVQAYSKPGEGFVQVLPEAREVVGYNPVHRIYQGAGKSAGFSGYYVVRFDAPVTSSGTWCGDAVSTEARRDGAGCREIGAYVRFKRGASGKPVLVKVGMSFTSLEEARKNLDAEIGGWDFDIVRKQTEQSWREWLGRVEVSGGTDAQQTVFYTALYHSALAPRMVSDADGTYNGFAQEGKLHKAAEGTAYYDDFSLWDTFRALHPLLTLVDPGREQQMVESLLDKGEQGGFLPIFPSWNSYTSEMIGDHASAVIVDAYAKGLRGFSAERAFDMMLRNAMQTPPREMYVEGKGRRALDSYRHYGFIPLEDEVPDAFHHHEQVSRTLEYAYDDFVLSRFARALHHDREADVLLLRSRNWRNVFDPTVGFVRGRHADGRWVEPFDPAKPAPYITEGVPWQYSFFVPQDTKGLILAMGGDEKFVAKLDGLFEKRLYDQGNEPSHNIAYLYNDAGVPWKTQERVHTILTSQFGTGAAGLPGNDDAGQMSAWFVLSALGIYPACPGVPEYELGTPMFPRVTLHLGDGKTFTIEAPNVSEKSFYVQKVSLDGKPLDGQRLQHEDVVRGGEMVFEMSSKPGVGRTPIQQ